MNRSISLAKCDICMEPYNRIQHCPRVCYACGNSVCEKCLSDIRYQQGSFKCPFCKAITDSWPKNLPLLALLDQEKDTLLCQPHGRKAVSVCTSPECTVPVAICDIGECSKIHKEKGTNVIPLVLLDPPTQTQSYSNFMLEAIIHFYDSLQQELLQQIRVRKEEAINRNLSLSSQQTSFTKEIEEIRQKILSGKTEDINSKQLSLLKSYLLDLEDQKDSDVRVSARKVIDQERKEMFPIIEKILANIATEDFSLLKAAMKANIKSSPTITRPPEKLPEWAQQVKKHRTYYFQPSLIFSSKVHNKYLFRSRIGGQPNLVFVIELNDGNIIGLCLRRPYIKVFFEDVRMVDRYAFVFWVNKDKTYKAATNSVAQYDVCFDHFLSVGNTNNWDGFWLKSDFDNLNPNQQAKNKLLIQSNQYEDMRIEVTTLSIKKFEVFQLDLM